MIYKDNKLTIGLVLKSNNHNQTKYINIQHHFIHDQLQQKIVTFHHISTNDQPADILTKRMGREKWSKIVHNLGLTFH
jgi:hypothetical protein